MLLLYSGFPFSKMRLGIEHCPSMAVEIARVSLGGVLLTEPDLPVFLPFPACPRAGQNSISNPTMPGPPLLTELLKAPPPALPAC